MNYVEKFLSHFKGIEDVGPGKWKARCPAHDDQSPSLSISLGHDGKLLHRCFVGCRGDDVRKAAGLSWSDYWPPLGEDEIIGQVAVGKSQGQEKTYAPHNHEVYEEFLNQLFLFDDHVEDLLARGLERGQIARNGYRSLSFLGASRALPKLEKRFTRERLVNVPGFRVSQRGKLEPVVPSGLLIPVRGLDGKILALKVRTGGKVKYKWFGGSGSPSTGSPCHVPLGIDAEVGNPLVIEGPLKADVVSALEPSFASVGVPGVANWKTALPILRAIREETVWVAFDGDWLTNPSVARALKECVVALAREWKVNVGIWNFEEAKGLDDLLCQGKQPTWQPLDSVFSTIAGSATKAKEEVICIQ